MRRHKSQFVAPPPQYFTVEPCRGFACHVLLEEGEVQNEMRVDAGVELDDFSQVMANRIRPMGKNDNIEGHACRKSVRQHLTHSPPHPN
jgi:hypothetical protein